MEVRVTQEASLPLRGQIYSGQPSAACSGAACGGSDSAAVPFPAPAAAPPVPGDPGRGGFRKVSRTEEAGPCPFPGLAPDVLQMRVKEGSKIRNLMGFAMARMMEGEGEGGEGGGQGCGSDGGGGGGGAAARQVVFVGSGRAVTKTITCAEIMKRKVPGLHQVTKLHYKGVQEVWESQEGGGGGASEMTVHRTVPSISVLLSKDPLDPREPGYQPPAAVVSPLWEAPSHGEREGEEPPLTTNKRPYHHPSTHASLTDTKRVCLMDRSHQC